MKTIDKINKFKWVTPSENKIDIILQEAKKKSLQENFDNAITYNYIWLADYCFDNGYVISNNEAYFYRLILHENKNFTKIALLDKKLDLSINNNHLIRWAIRENLPIIVRFLLRDKNIINKLTPVIKQEIYEFLANKNNTIFRSQLDISRIDEYKYVNIPPLFNSTKFSNASSTNISTPAFLATSTLL